MQHYQVLTVGSLFESPFLCLVPFCWETVNYEPNYGYPKSAIFSCTWEFIPGVEREKGLVDDWLDLQ